MKQAINTLLRALCLFVFAVAIGKLAGWVPAGQFERTPWVAGALLLAHLAELVFFFKHVRLYPGPLAVSVLLTLLFGVLHWKPLADGQAQVPR